MIPPKKSKLKRLWAALMLFALKAKAWLALVIAILVLALGAYLIYQLVRLIHKVLPDNGSGSATNNVAQIWYSPGDGTSWEVTSSDSTEIVTNNDDTLQLPSFTLYYGVMFEDQVPWVSTVALAPNGINTYGTNTETYVGVDTDQEYKFTLISGGVPMTFDFDVLDNIEISGPDQGVELAPIINTIVVQKTTDFVNWYPIATNTCGYDTVETNVDYNAVDPAAYYRIVLVSTNSASQ